MKSVFKALGDPTRRQILELLKSGDLTAGAIAEHFTMTKPSISYHLDLLQRADMVLRERKGQYIVYSLNTSVLDELVAWLMALQAHENENDNDDND